MSTGGGLTDVERRTRGAYSLTLVALLLLVLVGSTLSLPARLVIVVPLVLAAFISVRELIRLRRTGARGLSKVGPVVAVGLCVLMLLGTALQALLYGPQRDYEECMAGAQTLAAKAACAQQRDQSIIGSFGGL